MRIIIIIIIGATIGCGDHAQTTPATGTRAPSKVVEVGATPPASSAFGGEYVCICWDGTDHGGAICDGRNEGICDDCMWTYWTDKRPHDLVVSPDHRCPDGGAS